MSAYELTELAKADLEEIWDYVAERDSFDAADHVISTIETACQKLAKTPGIGHVREDLADREFRFWPVWSYLVIYLPETKPLEIIRVWHGYRGIPNLL